MSTTIPFGHPTEAIAGDTLRWRIAFPDFPLSDGYTLAYSLYSTSNAAQAPLTWSTSWITDDGSEWTVTIPAATMATLGAGAYTLAAHLTLAGVRETPYRAPLLVQADPAAVAVGQGVSHNEKVWAALTTLIEGRIPADVDSYSINGRALNRMTPEEIQRWERIYRERVYLERHGTLPVKRVSFWPSGA